MKCDYAYSVLMYIFVCLYVWGFFCPTQEYFTHKETSPLPVKGWTFWPMTSNVFFHSTTPTVTQYISVSWPSARTPDKSSCFCIAFNNHSPKLNKGEQMLSPIFFRKITALYIKESMFCCSFYMHLSYC